MKLTWHPHNDITLLVNGEAFYPAVFEAIEQARDEVLIETFILFEDPVGHALKDTLIAAARRGVRVSLTVDGYGSPEFSTAFISALTQAGVQMHVFDHQERVLGVRWHLIHRLHRKIVVVDGQVAFVGGINYSQDHLFESGPDSKQDYAVRVEGPLVADIHADALHTIAPVLRRRGWRQWWSGLKRSGAVPPPTATGFDPALPVAAFVKRDNTLHRNDIERCYRTAIRAAQHEIIIANAYFFPGYRMLRDLRRAARRGVRVELILQGKPDMDYVRTAAQLLYRALAKDGVRIHEYCQRPLHGKVAVIDGEWVTVGSSNLDPLSLSLNLEANIVAHDPDLAQTLRQDLKTLQADHCHRVCLDQIPKPNMWRYWLGALGFHISRGFPRWLSGLRPAKVRLRTYAATEVIDIEAPLPVPEVTRPTPGPDAASRLPQASARVAA